MVRGGPCDERRRLDVHLCGAGERRQGQRSDDHEPNERPHTVASVWHRHDSVHRIVRAEVGTGSPWDTPWLAFAAPVAIIAVVALLATYVPAKRALQTNAAELL